MAVWTADHDVDVLVLGVDEVLDVVEVVVPLVLALVAAVVAVWIAVRSTAGQIESG